MTHDHHENAKKVACIHDNKVEDPTSGGNNDRPNDNEVHQHGHCEHPVEKKHDPHAEESKSEDDKDVLCLAVVKENGASVSLFDVSGNVRSFSYNGDIRNLCFSSHGQNADDFLTPCFDDEGNHGVPDESCFCGVEEPHLHAHLHDPKTCNDYHEDSDLSKLARLTLRAEKEEAATSSRHSFAITDSMPNACNSKKYREQISIHDTMNEMRRQRMYKVQHDDHVDYLVHNRTTGDLHLEHPCDDCGDEDCHGKIPLLEKRRIKNEDSGGRNVQLHFFQVPNPKNQKFSLANIFEPHSSLRVEAFRAECLSVFKEDACQRRRECSKRKSNSPCCDRGECDSSKVSPEPPSTGGGCRANKEPIGAEMPSCCSSGNCTDNPDDMAAGSKPSGATKGASEIFVRSTIDCQGMCCSSEVPAITKIVNGLEGTEKCMCNVPLRQVLIDHNPDKISAKSIEDALNGANFKAKILSDGGTARSGNQGGSGRSTLFVAKICCASEVPAINSILNPIDGVSKVSINITGKLVYVDHDTSIVNAEELASALNASSFGARVEEDAASKFAFTSSFVSSVFSFSKTDDTDDLRASEEKIGNYLRTLSKAKVESFKFDEESGEFTVVHNSLTMTSQQIQESLVANLNLETSIKRDGGNFVNWEFPDLEEDTENKREKAKLRPTIIASGIFWIVSMLSFIGGDWEVLKYVALLSVAFGIPPIAMKALQSIMRYQLDTNCLMFFASLGALALQEFTEAAAVTFLFAISEWLEVRATARARNALSAIVSLRPESANLIHPKTNEVMVVPARAVPVGALVSVRTGDKFPCDGIVTEGSSVVDESSLTGESRPIRKTPGDNVSGGTVNSGSTQLMVQTTATSDDSAVSRLIRLVEEAQANRSNTEKLVDEFARVYTPIVVLAALLMCTIPWAWGRDVGNEWTRNGLVLLVIACPCALIISTPVSYVAGLAATAQRGILIKGGAHLEALGLVKHICFDKTGTLTQGKFQLLHLNILGQNRTRKEVLEFLSCIEERASHPLADSIVQAAKNEGVTIPKGMFVADHTFLAGEGVRGTISGKEVHVGNLRLFQRLGLLETVAKDEMAKVKEWESKGGTVGLMSIEGDGIVCSYCVADAVRPESAEVVKTLHKMGLTIVMLTGDNQDVANTIGHQIGLVGEEVKGRLLPEEKLELVAGLKLERDGAKSIMANLCSTPTMVLMCGDGVNDAPALATADIGVAMGAGAALAMETADVTLLDSHLEKLVYSIQMGKRVIRKIKENMIFSISVKFLVLGFALTGKAALWAAILSDVGGMLVVTLNGLMLLPSSKKANTAAAGTAADVEKVV